MNPRLAPGIALALGAAALAAAWAVLDPRQIPTVLLGASASGLILLAAHAIARFRARRRQSRFGRELSDLLPDLPADQALALGHLPWFIVLTAQAPNQARISPGRRAVFAHLNPAASAPLLHALRALRPRAPIAGAILSLPADRLLTQTPAIIQRQTAIVAGHLDTLRRELGSRFPVTITITHTRCLRGFEALATAAGAANILGWSNPAPLDSAMPIASFDEAITRIRDDLRRARLNLLTGPQPGPAPLAQADELFPLAEKTAALAKPLRSLAVALAPIHIRDGRPRFFLRGLYLTSGRTFLPAILSDRLLPERHLSCPQRARTRPARHAPAIAAAALLAPALAVALTLVLRSATLRVPAAPTRAAAAPIPPSIAAPTPSRSASASIRARINAALAQLPAVAGRVSGTIDQVRDGLPRFLAATLSTPEAVSTFADQLAIAAPAPNLPTLPCTGPDPLAPRFRTEVARAVFAEFQSLSPTLPLSELERLTDAFTAYAADYVRAWTAIAEPRIAAAPWPQLRQSLASINPARVNRDARDLLFATTDALSIVPSDLGQDQPIAVARAAILRETAALDVPWFDQACRRVRDKWAAVEPSGARSAILRLSRSTFQNDFLPVYAEPGQPGSRYWSGLTLAALSAIADTSAPRAAADAFIQNTRAFPLCASAVRTLEPGDLSAARDFTAGIIRTGLTSSIPDDSLPLSRGARTDFPAINDQLARMVGDSDFDTDARDQWAYRLRAVLNFLDQPQTCTLVLLDPSQQTPIDGATPAAIQVPQFSLTLDQDPPLGPFFTDRAADPGIAFDLPGPDLAFTFRSAQGAIATIHLPKPWHVVALLHQPGATIDDDGDPSGRLVRAPLVFTDASGQRWCYWIGLRFQRPPPALTQWPSDADWPD